MVQLAPAPKVVPQLGAPAGNVPVVIREKRDPAGNVTVIAVAVVLPVFVSVSA
jgi:hypothetical protein